jgi:CheY-like chemotaxis protein
MHPHLQTALSHPAAVIVFGPGLPGRRALARVLEHRLPRAQRIAFGRRGTALRQVMLALSQGMIPIIEGDLRNADERAALRRLLIEAGAQPVFVAWLLDPAEAQREIYRRYASLPRRYADHWWRLWQEDAARRDPAGAEIPTDSLVTAGAHETHLHQVEHVAKTLGLRDRPPADAPLPRRVLVVDDDRDQRELLAEALQELGCLVYLAGDFYEALALADRVPIDLVVTDQQMPGPSGTDLARELARRHPDVHIAILTGYAEETVEEATQTEGVELLLAKPVHAADLVRLLDELTE